MFKSQTDAATVTGGKIHSSQKFSFHCYGICDHGKRWRKCANFEGVYCVQIFPQLIYERLKSLVKIRDLFARSLCLVDIQKIGKERSDTFQVGVFLQMPFLVK